MSTLTPPSLGSLFMDFAREAIRSKKFWALITGILAVLAALVAPHFGATEEQASAAVTKVTALVMTYILGQGVADVGKEKAKTEASAAKLPA